MNEVMRIAESTILENRTFDELAHGERASLTHTVSRNVEHIGVVYSGDSMREALSWLDATFVVTRDEHSYLDGRGP